MNKTKKQAEVFHFDLYGKREDKYDFLNRNSIASVPWNELEVKEPSFFFIPKNFSVEIFYNYGFKIDVLFLVKAAGIKTHKDDVVIGYNNIELEFQVKNHLASAGNRDINFSNNNIKKITYRPFDNRVIYYDTILVVRHRKEQIKHSFKKNYSILCGRQTKGKDINHFFISNVLSEMKTAERSSGSYHFPLYFYPDSEQSRLSEKETRQPNLNMEIVQQIAEKLSLTFTREKDVSTGSSSKGTFAPIDILDYIYAVLHSPTYREKYKEFLKIDFPRVPYPKNAEIFWQTVGFGAELRQIHLLESPVVEKRITTYPQSGENLVEKIRFENGRVWINKEQYFGNVPETAWEFYIGGYQPAQKWLKDRKGRVLSFDDILHYQKITVALFETDKVMKEIDKIDFM